MRLGGGRMGEGRYRAFVPLFELGLSVWTVTCLRICWQLKGSERKTMANVHLGDQYSRQFL